MIDPLVVGLMAGVAISAPVSMGSVVVIELTIRRGIAIGLAAAAGIVTARLAFVVLATVVARVAGPDGLLVDLTAAVFLGVVAGWGLLWLLLGGRGIPSDAVLPERVLPAYLRLLAIALLRATEIVFFAGLGIAIVGLGIGAANAGPVVIGVALAVVAIEAGLVAAGLARRRLSTRVQRVLGVVGYGLMLVLAYAVATSG